MRIRDDGSVQPSALPTYLNTARSEDNATYRCMVIKTIFVDDPSNITANSSNPRVLYDCVVLGGFKAGQIVSNCRLSSTLGGNFNFWERTLRAASKDVSKTKLANNDGDIVFVNFVQGHTGYPVITSLDSGIDPTNDGATSSDGQISKWQYNGISFDIDKNGNLIFTRKGGSYNAETKSFTPTSGGKKIKVSMQSQTINITLENGLTVAIDGDSDKIVLKTKGGGSLNLSGGKVALGTSATELLDKVSSALQECITVATPEAAHDHLGNLGYPTGPTSAAGAWNSFKSAMTALKSAIDAIKGSIT